MTGRGRDTQSRAAIMRHPIHPMLVPFPIAFLSGAFATDFIHQVTRDPFWIEASFWLLLAGFGTALLAAVPGSIDYLSIKRARTLAVAHVHAAGNVVIVTLTGLNLWLRWGDHVAGGSTWGLMLSGLTAGLLVVAGWLGGEMSYRHRIGMMASEDADLGPDGDRSGRTAASPAAVRVAP